LTRRLHNKKLKVLIWQKMKMSLLPL